MIKLNMIEWFVLLFFATSGAINWFIFLKEYFHHRRLIKKNKDADSLPKEGEHWSPREWPPFEEKMKVLVKNVASTNTIVWIKYQIIDKNLQGVETYKVSDVSSFICCFEKILDAPDKPKLKLVKSTNDSLPCSDN